MARSEGYSSSEYDDVYKYEEPNPDYDSENKLNRSVSGPPTNYYVNLGVASRLPGNPGSASEDTGRSAHLSTISMY